MRSLDKELQNRVIDINKLLSYGFIEKDNIYEYKYYLLDNKFQMIVQITKDKKISTKVIDLSTNEEYILINVSSACGNFIGKIKEEYENKLNDIINNCTVMSVFKSDYAKCVIQYIKDKYNDELEFLWEKSSNNAIVRHKENAKWYAVFLIVEKNKLGLTGNEMIEVIDLKNTKEEIQKLINNKKYFPGYHMNKTHWFIIKLDGSVALEKIFEFIDISYSIK